MFSRILIVLTLLWSGLTFTAVEAAAARAEPEMDWRTALEKSDAPPTSPPVKRIRSAPEVDSTSTPKPKRTRIPAATSAEVRLDAKPQRVGPLEVSGAAGTTARVEVLEERASLPGLGFRISAATKVSVDFGGFAERYGAGYADRLKLVRFPECALTADCARQGAPSLKDGIDRQVVPSVKNGTKLSAEVPAGLFVVTAGPEGEEGSFKATPLTLSGDWQVVTGSGNFTYTYDVPLQKAPAGPPPSLSLSYSSGTVDGMVSGRNTQSGPIGLGWGDFADSFIERRYNSCRADGQGSDDLCWKSDNATISLNGRSGELVPLPGTPTKQWRLKDDPRWRIEQLTGAKNGDNDGEHWKVTTPDGVQYFFGRGVNPDVVGVETHSVWTVPVFGDDAGEPCNAEAPLPWCVQAWRWNLDLVIDPHDNVQQYEYVKETNHYAALNGWPGFERTEYVRGGALHLLKYGKRRAPNETEPSARVTFDLDYRCGDLAAACQEPTPATAANYPDTPVDLMCFTGVCTEHAPTFFTALRYVSLTTQVEVGGDEFVDVDRITLSHAFPDPDPNRTGDQKLYLTAIQRKGMSDEERITMPPVTFWPVLLNNRVDTAGGLSAMPHYRVGVVTNETGGQVIVTYGQPHPCPSPIPNPPNWHLNTRNCFPHWHAPDGGVAGFAVFRKYVVSQVEQRDTVGGSPAMITSYKYGDQVRAGLPNGAWHHDRDEFVSNANQTWSEWRGYADIQVTQGASRTQYRLFRGMNGDRLAGDPFPGPGSRVVKTSSLDGTVTNVNDENWLAGGVLDQQVLRSDGSVEHGTVTGYHARRTVDAAGPDPLDDAWFVMPDDRVERRRNPADGSLVRSRSQTVYNALLGTADKVIEHGWLASTGDERCTATVPTVNPDQWLLDLPASVTRYGNATCDGAELAREEYAYDGGAFGGAPTRGDRTGSRVKITAAPTWATTTTTYDKLGRPLKVTDPNGHATTTAHTPAIRYPATTTVTNHLGHKTTTTWFRPRQVPEATIDARGKKTSFAYDALGRTRTVHRPTEQGGSASHEFVYELDPDKAKPGVVRTRRLQDTTRYVDSWVLHDSWLRPRQAHVLSPESGKVIVTDTRYEGSGLVAATSQPQALAGMAGAGLFPVPAGGWANDESTAYDELRRPVWQISWTAGAARRSVVTDYTHDSVTTTPHPSAGGVVRKVSDAHGRVIRMEERDGNAWRLTRYGYDKADRLATITDPAGNTITNTYDLAGRKIAMNDPDMGAWTYGFDAAGNQTRATDAAGAQVHTVYDALDRPKERRKDSPAGALLASWAYDATGETGLLNKTTRLEGAGSYVVDVTGYDGRARPTGQTWIFPDASYTVGYGYDAADHPTRITYPAIGGLPAETVNTTYNDVGLAATMVGGAEYVWAALYDDRARSVWNLSGSRTVPFSRVTEYDADQRVKAIKAGGGDTTLQDLQFTYDDTFGNIVDRHTTLNGQSWRECFDHDDRQRLTRAFTTTGTCTAGTPGTGANAYDHTYTLSVDGNLTRRVESGTQINYTYPAAGGTRPHAPTAVGGNTYTWNANGDLASRTISGQTETLTWSPERLLLAAGTSSFVYDADGKRLQRKTTAGTTRYIDGHEITGSTAVRTYSFNDTPIAIRTTTGVEYLATDNQGSVQLTVPTASVTPSHARSYQPYGKPRGTDRPSTDRGWIGQIEDSATGLNYLNARYYDPSMGRFVSPDPLFDVARPQTINPYAYGLNNPTAFSDPSGLIPDACALGEIKCTFNGKGWINVQPVQSTPEPPSLSQDICAPGSSGNTDPACGPRERGTIAGGEDLTVDDLAERVIDGSDTALDAVDLGLELCTDSLGCARITGFVEATGDIGFATGAIGVVIDCESQGWTSQACVKGAVLEGGQLIPGVGVVFLTLDVLDQFGLVDPVIDFLQEMFTSDGRSPVRTCDSGSRPEYGCTHLPSGGQGEYTGSAGVPPPCTGCAAPQAGPCPLRGCDHNSYNLND